MKVQTVLAIAGGIFLFPLYRFMYVAIKRGHDDAFSRRSAAIGWMSYSLWIIYGLSKAVPDVWMVYFTAPGVALFQTMMILGHTYGIWRGRINAVLRKSFLSILVVVPLHIYGVFQHHRIAYGAAALVVVTALIVMGRQRLADNMTFANDLTRIFSMCSFCSCVLYVAYAYVIGDKWMFELQLAGAILAIGGFGLATWAKSERTLWIQSLKRGR